MDNTGSTGLRFTAEVQVNQHRRSVLMSVVDVGVDDTQDARKQRLEVTLTSDQMKVEIAEPGILGRPCSIMGSRDSGNLTYVDPETKGFFRIPDDHRVRMAYRQPLVCKIDRTGKRSAYEGRQVTEVIVHIQEPRGKSFVQRLLVCADSDLMPFAGQTVDLMMGGGACACGEGSPSGYPAGEIAKLGMPLSARICVQGDDEYLTSTTINELKVGDVNPAEFMLPKESKDLGIRWRDELKRPAEKRLVPLSDTTAHPAMRPVMPPVDLDDLSGYPPTGSHGSGDSPQPDDGGEEDEQPSIPSSDWHIPDVLEPTPVDIVSPDGPNKVAVNVRQPLVDDIRQVTGIISERMRGFTAGDGELVIDWLEQLRIHAHYNPGRDGIFCLLHDEHEGLGLLDDVAQEIARDIMSIPSGAAIMLYNELAALGIGASTRQAILQLLADPGLHPEARFEALEPDHRDELTQAVLWRRVGVLRADVPEETEWETIAGNLLQVRLRDISFNLDINPATAGQDAVNIVESMQFIEDDEIVSDLLAQAAERRERAEELRERGQSLYARVLQQQAQVLEMRAARKSHGLRLGVHIPGARFSALLDRKATRRFWFSAVGAAASCLVLPFSCAVTSTVAAVAVILAHDFGEVEVHGSGLQIEARVHPQVQEDGQVGLRLGWFGLSACDFGVYHVSSIPSGVHQVFDKIVNYVLQTSDKVFDELEDALGSELSDLLDDVPVSFPGDVCRFGATIGDSGSCAREGKDLYLESRMVPADADTEVGDVDTAMRDFIRSDGDRFSADLDAAAGDVRHYLSFALSQGFLNHYALWLWTERAFGRKLDSEQRNSIGNQIFRLIYSDAGQGSGGVSVWKPRNVILEAEIQVNSPPRVRLTPASSAAGGYAAVTHFDDLRLRLKWLTSAQSSTGPTVPRHPRILHLEFAARVPTQIAFGLAELDEEEGEVELNIRKINEQLLDLYFNTAGAIVEAREIQEVAGASFGTDDADLVNWESVMQQVLDIALEERQDELIERGSRDPINVQRYSVAGHQVRVQHVPHRGVLYCHAGFAGPLLSFEYLASLSCADARAILQLLNPPGDSQEPN